MTDHHRHSKTSEDIFNLIQIISRKLLSAFLSSDRCQNLDRDIFQSSILGFERSFSRTFLFFIQHVRVSVENSVTIDP